MVNTSRYNIPSIFRPYAGIVAGSNKLAFQHIGTFKQSLPLNISITKHARVRCTPCHIFARKIVDDTVAKLTTQVEYIMWEPTFYSQMAGIVNRIKTATACFLFIAT